MTTASDALERLKLGNQRFVAGLRDDDNVSHHRRVQLADGQQPFAIILGCSDSRVPAELVFDQGLGDLFVIRVAGNVVAPSQVGSVEFAASVFGSQLVVVLGHTRCGAIAATLSELEQPQENQSPNLKSIVDRIRPSVRSLMDTPLAEDRDSLIQHAVRANIQASVDHLSHGSQILEELIGEGKLTVVGAEYDLATGVVDFFDGATE